MSAAIGFIFSPTPPSLAFSGLSVSTASQLMFTSQLTSSNHCFSLICFYFLLQTPCSCSSSSYQTKQLHVLNIRFNSGSSALFASRVFYRLFDAESQQKLGESGPYLSLFASISSLLCLIELLLLVQNHHLFTSLCSALYIDTYLFLRTDWDDVKHPTDAASLRGVSAIYSVYFYTLCTLIHTDADMQLRLCFTLHHFSGGSIHHTLASLIQNSPREI